MADDKTDVEGLRLIAWSLEGGNVKMADECRRAAAEIERLRRQVAERDEWNEQLVWQFSDLLVFIPRPFRNRAYRRVVRKQEARRG